MRSEQAVVIRKAVQAIGVGLLERALEREGAKGCSPFLCSASVGLEPPYEVFDARCVLRALEPARELTLASVESVAFVTLNVYAAEEDVLSIAWMETVLRSLAVLDGPFAFELFGSNGIVWIRFAVPLDQLPGFRAALLGHFPALVLEEVADPFPSGTPVVEEFVPVGPYHRTLSLLGAEGASPLGLATQVLAGLGGAGVLQVLFTPTRHDWLANVGNLVEAEVRAANLGQLGGLSSEFRYDPVLPAVLDASVAEKARVDVAPFAVVVRCACWDPGAADAFVQGMRVATGMVRFGRRAWRTLDNGTLTEALGPDSVRRMVVERRAHRPGLVVTSREVATLVHVPNARTLAMLTCIAQRRGYPWPLLGDTGARGACLGRNEYAGAVRPVEIPLGVRLRHTYVLGATGTGKSKLVERLAVDDAHTGLGFCLVDPHGDLCLEVLSRIPESRMQDLVYVSFGEPGLVPRWNPFVSGIASGKLADDVARAFLAQAGSTGARMEHNFRMLAYVVAELGGTLEDFAELAARGPRGNALREEALARIGNPQVQRFLRSELPKYAASDLASVVNKLSRLLLDDQLGGMFRQPENALQPRAWMDEGRIVLVNLAAGMIGADHARFVGSLLVSLLYRAALSRADTPVLQRRPFVLYLDEFQQLQAATLTELLGEGRKYGVGAVLAHQERGQLGTELAQALGNCATKVVFRPSEDDLAYVHRVLGARFDADGLRALGVGEAALVCEGRGASLRTELSPHRAVRDPRTAALAYAAAHYLPAAQSNPPARRPRVYDVLRSDP